MVDGGETGAYEIMFGGRKPDAGQPDGFRYSGRFSLLYRNDRALESDYEYEFITPLGDAATNAPHPSARAFHAATMLNNGHMVVLGGSNGSLALTDVWDGGFSTAGRWYWHQVISSSTDSLGPRYAHEAVYVPTLKCLFVFGGTSALGADPESAAVWSMSTEYTTHTADSDTVHTVWTRCTAVGGVDPPLA